MTSEIKNEILDYAMKELRKYEYEEMVDDEWFKGIVKKIEQKTKADLRKRIEKTLNLIKNLEESKFIVGGYERSDEGFDYNENFDFHSFKEYLENELQDLLKGFD